MNKIVTWLYKGSAFLFSLVYRVSGLSDKVKLRILCYHSVSDLEAGMIYPVSNVQTREFHCQMEYLHKNRYHSPSFEVLERYLKGEGDLPEKSIIVSFDDGFKNICDNAIPILSAYGFCAIVFISTDYIDDREKFEFVDWEVWGKMNGNSNSVDSGFLPLSKKDILDLSKLDNVMIASHGCTHVPYNKMPRKKRICHLKNSKTILEKIIDKSVLHFAFPNGEYDSESLDLATREYIYIYSVEKGSVPPGSENNTNIIPRHSINMHQSFHEFIVQVSGGYDAIRKMVNWLSRKFS